MNATANVPPAKTGITLAHAFLYQVVTLTIVDLGFVLDAYIKNAALNASVCDISIFQFCLAMCIKE